MNKQEAISHILETMRKNNVSLDDIKIKLAFEASEEGKGFDNFDLLCIKDGKKYRLPFEIGKNFSPVGIFPFGDSNLYLEFEEKKNEFRYRIFEERLPQYEFFEKMFDIRKELNTHLNILDKPPLLGNYFTKLSPDKLVWFVGFESQKDEMVKMGYNPTKRAKARYVGTF